MNKIYLVVCHVGDWEDHWEHSIVAFPSETAATTYKEKQESGKLVYDPYYEKLLERIASYAQSVADRKGLNPDYDDYWDVVDGIEEPLKAKVKKKYPNYTDCRWEENLWYSIKEVDFYTDQEGFNFNLERMQSAVESGTFSLEDARARRRA